MTPRIKRKSGGCAGFVPRCRGRVGSSSPGVGHWAKAYTLAKRNLSVLAQGGSLGIHVQLKALALILKLTSAIRTLREVPVGYSELQASTGEGSFER